jgi:ribosomal protein S18 acetylase RimI-like enzyme
MDSPPIIRNAEPADLDILVDTLSNGFARDPMFNWLFPKTQLYPSFFHMLIKDVYLPHGIVHIEEQGRAAALWLPPQDRFEVAPRLSLLKFGLQLIKQDGLRPVWRLRQQGLVFAKHLPSEPHYYLQFLGCRQQDQGRGIGAALLRQGTKICDERGMPAYLESSNERNLPLYQRHGFEVRATQAVAKNGPSAWFMWREAR